MRYSFFLGPIVRVLTRAGQKACKLIKLARLDSLLELTFLLVYITSQLEPAHEQLASSTS